MTAPCVLITRHAAPCDWEAEGLHSLHCPLLNIHIPDNTENLIKEALARHPHVIIVTSQHALACLPETLSVPLAVVGKATAQHAAARGYETRLVAEGNVASLRERIRQQLQPQQGAVLYLRGEHISTDLARALREDGFTVEEIEAYQALPISELPAEVVAALQQGAIHAITAYSARSLSILEHLIQQHALIATTSTLPLVCFSAAIAQHATASLWQKIIPAAAAEDAQMLAVFKHLFGSPPRITTKA